MIQIQIQIPIDPSCVQVRSRLPATYRVLVV